jgi:Ca2+-binding EF-hand superfamily protein
MYPTVANTGYYDNTANKYGEFDEDNPVIETQMPYVEGTDILPVCYLKQDCNFINAGYEYIEETRLIGKTTDVGSFPDSNKTDIGFHYPNWNFSNAGSTTLYADFDNNLRVDFNDLLQFADYWLYDYDENHERWLWDLDNNGTIDINDLDTFSNYWLIYINFVNFASFAQHWHQEVDYSFMFVKYDLNNDRFIDFLDFALFANEWQQSCEPIPANISPDFSEDPNNLSGYVQVSISVTDPNIHRAFVLLDGKKHGEFGDLFDP